VLNIENKEVRSTCSHWRTLYTGTKKTVEVTIDVHFQKQAFTSTLIYYKSWLTTGFNLKVTYINWSAQQHKSSTIIYFDNKIASNAIKKLQHNVPC